MFSLKKVFLSLITLSSFFVAATPALAASPDGFGPWADKVVSTQQGLMKNGQPVPAIRSSAQSALGVAENDTVEGHFYSLGLGGKITLGFKNGMRNGVIVVEATNPNYPLEKATVEVSPDKEHWFTAGTVTQDGQVTVPQTAGCVHYVRLTDVSNAADFGDGTADGYDVDGVKGTGERCSIRERHNPKNHNSFCGSYSAKKEQEIDNGD
ncbi:MAG: hypothetical protein ABI758_04810 [Candidatus Woesebacteria bacterium]